MSKLRSRASVAAIAASLLLAACGGGGSDSSPADTDTSSSAASTPVPTDAPEDTIPPETETADPAPAAQRCGAVVGDAEYEPIDCGEPHDAEFAGFASTSTEPASDDDVDFHFEMVGLCADQVSGLTGRPSEQFGIDVGPVHLPDADGDSNVECWARMATPKSLTGSLRDVSLGEAIGDYALLVDMEPGTCYLEPEAGYDIGTVTECGDAGAIQFVAALTLSIDEYDDDAISDEGFVMCEQAIADADFEVAGTAYSILTPFEDGWRALDRRTVVCLSLVAEDDVVDVASAGPDDPCAVNAGSSFAAIPCEEPHGAEYAGTIAPPVDVLPVDADEARSVMVVACSETVSTFIDRDLSDPGLGVGFLVSSGLGDPITADIPCYFTTGGDDGLVGSIAEVGFADALDKLIVPEQEPGTCFVHDDDNFSWGAAADCSEPDALMFIGNIQLDDGPFPGDDAIRELRAVVCTDLLVSSGLAADQSTVSGTFPGEQDWNHLGRRNLACDASPL